jgi:hypothetical protein
MSSDVLLSLQTVSILCHQEEVAAAAHLRRQVADQAAALEAADAELGQLRTGADIAQDAQDRASAALQAQLEEHAAEVRLTYCKK